MTTGSGGFSFLANRLSKKPLSRGLGRVGVVARQGRGLDQAEERLGNVGVGQVAPAVRSFLSHNALVPPNGSAGAPTRKL